MRTYLLLPALLVATVVISTNSSCARTPPDETHDNKTFKLKDNVAELYVINADGSNPVRLGVRDISPFRAPNPSPPWRPVDELPLTVTHPAWSPDGNRIAFWWNNEQIRRGWASPGQELPFESEIGVVNADGTILRSLTRGNTVPGTDTPVLPRGGPGWSLDGKRIAFDSNEGLIVMNADGSELRQVNYFREPFLFGPDVDTMTGPSVGLGPGFTSSPEHPAITVVTSTDSVLSPDGVRIAFVLRGDEPTDRSIWVINSDGSDPHRLASGQRIGGWSMDGKRIAFDANGKQMEINPDGSGLKERTLPFWYGPRPSFARGPLSPDGTMIAFLGVENSKPDWDIWVRDNPYRLTDSPITDNQTWDDPLQWPPGSGNPYQLTSSPTFDDPLVWSPDSHKILFKAFIPPPSGGILWYPSAKGQLLTSVLLLFVFQQR